MIDREIFEFFFFFLMRLEYVIITHSMHLEIRAVGDCYKTLNFVLFFVKISHFV